MLTFEQPLLLLLLLPMAIAVYLMWQRMALPFPRKQRLIILATRLALLLLVITALAGAAWSQKNQTHPTHFVGDISASTGPQRTFMEHWINSALQQKRPEDQVGIVAVGRNALVEQSLKTQIDFSHFESTPDTNFTDLAAGLRLAAAILPTDSLRRIVLLSDGQQNLGDALQEAQLLQQEGIRLDVVALPAINGPEARIDGLDAPKVLRTNERFLLHIGLFSTIAQQAILHLYLDQTLISQQTISLAAGEQESSLSLMAPPPGFHTFRVTLEAQQDTILANNEGSVAINVQGPPRVLLIEGQPGAGTNIAAALNATKIDVTIGTPSDIPTTLDGLAGYSSIVLADVPAISLGTTRMLIIQSFVRDLGRGLVVSGGENSYGVGGYAGTPLEQTLPVRMDIPQHKDSPSIAVVLIIESLENDTGINISKEAAKGVISLLTSNDQVGISSGYGNLSVPMQHVTDKAAINKLIDSMSPNDPGSYNPDFINAEQVLLHTSAKIKHVILLGDGDAFDSYAKQLIQMANENITVSTVATNATTGTELGVMQQIASWGKGRFYRADDPTTIPQILLKETQQAARRAIIDDPFTPAIVGNHPIMTGINALPILGGYVATTPKSSAQLILISNLDDPVLAVWQYGLGRVAAWTSDALGHWTKNWLLWDQGAQWWANLVSWTLPSPESALTVNTKVVGGTAQLTVDLPPGTTAATGGQQQVQVRIISPDLSQQSITLQPTAPARWEGSFPAFQVGAYLLEVTWQGQNSTTSTSPNQLMAVTALIVPYSPEYQTTGTDLHFLTLLAKAGGGKMIGSNDYAAAFTANLQPVSAPISIVFWLFALAALLLPLDIAARRLASLEFITMALDWLAIQLRFRKSPLVVQTVQPAGTFMDSTLGNLRAKREERRSQLAKVQSIPTMPKIERQATGTVVNQPGPAEEQITPQPVKTQPARSETLTTSKLLEARRNREKTK